MSKKWLILGSVSFGVGLSLSLIINRDIKQAALTGLLSVPATAAGVLVTEHQRQQRLKDRISIKQEQLQALVKQEAELNNSITVLSKQLENYNQQQEDIKTSIATFDADKLKSQAELKTLRERINELDDRKSNLEAEINALEIKLQHLQQQETDLSNSKQHIEKELESDRQTVVELRSQKSDLEQNLRGLAIQIQETTEQLNSQQLFLDRLQQEKTNFQKAIANLSGEKQELEQQQENIKAFIATFDADKLKSQTELETLQEQTNELDNRKSNLEAEINALQIKLQQLQQQKTDLSDFKQRIEKELETDPQTVIKLRSQKSDLEQNLRGLAIQIQETTEQLNSQQLFLDRLQQERTDFQKAIANLSKDKQGLEQQQSELNSDVERLTKEKKDLTVLIQRLKLYIDNYEYDLNNPEHTKYLWENVILPRWNHKDSLAGYRFLGNVEIDSTQSDRIIDLLQKKFQQSEGIPNYLENNLLKIITFVLSEYAYYSQEESFWQGFCDRLCIEHSPAVENTFREITEQGINLLGLIRASGGYKYVSSLWLQSGVPKQNMGHFAAILQDVVDEYGWWELSHNLAEDIAEVLWQCWQNRYSQWGTIGHFLSLDNSNEDIEPISGQLVKNIAIVARELKHRNLSPEEIRNKETREEIINSSNLSYNFFLREWNDLIVVLGRSYGNNSSRIVKKLNPEPYLYLDVADTLNTLLILPEQSLWNSQWKNLRGSYYLIPEAEWEDTIPNQGNIEIPELEIDIKQANERWRLQLQNHHRNEIYSWEYQGINSEFPCLIFDAISGDNIRVNIPEAKIIGIEEIIVFTHREVEIELDNNIEITDNLVPSSIRGWRGKEIRLTQSEAMIQVKDVIIVWQLREQEQPQLIGLRLKGKKDIYINAPTFYYPPPQENLIINYLIEDIKSKSIIAKDSFSTYDFNSWNSFDLSYCIKCSGNYYATFWHQEKQWLYKFEVRQKYRVTQHQGYRNLEICDRDDNFLSIPAKYTDIDKFWAAEIKFCNLYPFEELSFRLKNNNEQYQFQTQADSQGKLTLALASLYGRLSQDDRCSLDAKKSGLEFQRVLQIGYLINWELTAKQLIFTEIPSADNYCLSGWNLLNPDSELEKINFSSNYQPTAVELSFSPGIYLIQLCQEKQLIKNIGLWCGIDPRNIPDEINNNETLANYCYTILDNEPLADFSTALKELKVDFDREPIQIILNLLHQNNCYLPEWLDKDGLTKKIQKILASLLQLETLETNNIVTGQENTDKAIQANTITGQWCLVTVRPYKRELFIKCLSSDIEQKQLQQLIVEIVAPEEPVYKDNILLRISNFIEARKILQKIESFQNIQRLKLNEVNQMLNQ